MGSRRRPVFEGIDGKQHALSAYLEKSKWIVIGVWRPRRRYCHEEMPEREQMHRTRSADISVIGIAVDYPSMGYAKADEVREFVREHRLNYPILLSDGEVVPKLGGGEFIGTPTTLISIRRASSWRVNPAVFQTKLLKTISPSRRLARPAESA